MKLIKNKQKSYKKISIYYTGYIIIKKIDCYENTHSVNPLHLTIDEVNGFIDEKNGNKYLVHDSTDYENK